jgi:histidine decarboxylase
MYSPRDRTAPVSLVSRRATLLLLAAVTDMEPATEAMLTELHRRISAAQAHNIGFPAAVDVDWSPLSALLTGGLLNNVGSPDDDGTYPCHTKPMERAVVGAIADLFRAPAGHRGHVTDGATTGTIWSLYQARTLHPDAIVYHSQSAHYSVPKAAALLRMPTVVVRVDDSGIVDYDDLRRHVGERRDRGAIVVANIGTTMTEAHDDVRLVARILDDAVAGRWIHADAALSGIPLGLMDPALRPGLDFGDGADSIVVSGHKFLGTPRPCAVVITRDIPATTTNAPVPYIDAHDETIAGSRDGHAALMLWWVWHTLGLDGLRHRAERSRALAAYTLNRLETLGWPAFRNTNAFTVVLKAPPCDVVNRWNLPTEDGWSHIICMPGVTQARIDRFIRHLTRAVRPGLTARAATNRRADMAVDR